MINKIVKYGSTTTKSPTTKATTITQAIIPALHTSGFDKIETVASILKLSNDEAERFLEKADRPLIMQPDRYLYLRTLAVSSLEEFGPNDNHDAFPFEELEKYYDTFVYVPVFLNHNNTDTKDSVGIVFDSVLKRSPNYDLFKKTGAGSGWVENLFVIDIPRAERMMPGLTTLLAKGVVTDTSMGCLAEYSECSVPSCRKKIYDISDYCEHLENKNLKLATNQLPKNVFELVRNPLFFEDSIITDGDGADSKAKFLSKYASSAQFSETRKFVNTVTSKYSTDKEISNKELYSIYNPMNNSNYQKVASTKYYSIVDANGINYSKIKDMEIDSPIPVSNNITSLSKQYIASTMDHSLVVADNLIAATREILEHGKEASRIKTADLEGDSGSQKDSTYKISPISGHPGYNMDEDTKIRMMLEPPPGAVEKETIFDLPFSLFGKDYIKEQGIELYENAIDNTPLVTSPPITMELEFLVDDTEKALDIVENQEYEDVFREWFPISWKKPLKK